MATQTVTESQTTPIYSLALTGSGNDTRRGAQSASASGDDRHGDTYETLARPASLPVALCAQIRQHPWARTAASRQAGEGIAALAADSDIALQAARMLTRNLWHAARTFEPAINKQDLFGSFDGYDAAARRPRFWASGDIHFDDVSEAYEEGNLRELMTMALNASYRLERHMTAAGARGAFNAPAESLAAASAQMRRPRHGTAAPTPLRETAAKLATPQHPPLSPREKRHLRTYLAQQSRDGAVSRLPTQLGKHRWQPRYDHPFMQTATAHGLHLVAGVSGTTHRLMAMHLALCGDKHMEAMRLACVGYLTPHHHALHEVLTAAAWFGCRYAASLPPAAQLGL